MPKPPAKPSQHRYRRDLPHINSSTQPLFITFNTLDRWLLPESVRTPILNHCLHDHNLKLRLRCAIIMPDHVHLILNTLTDSTGTPYALAEIMNSIKGASAHTINRLLHRKGPVWQLESFDHILRLSENVPEKIHYIYMNPVRRHLITNPADYPWFWCDTPKPQ